MIKLRTDMGRPKKKTKAKKQKHGSDNPEP